MIGDGIRPNAAAENIEPVIEFGLSNCSFCSCLLFKVDVYALSTGMVSSGVLWQARPFHVDLIYRAPHSRSPLVTRLELKLFRNGHDGEICHDLNCSLYSRRYEHNSKRIGCSSMLLGSSVVNEKYNKESLHKSQQRRVTNQHWQDITREEKGPESCS